MARPRAGLPPCLPQATRYGVALPRGGAGHRQLLPVARLRRCGRVYCGGCNCCCCCCCCLFLRLFVVTLAVLLPRLLLCCLCCLVAVAVVVVTVVWLLFTVVVLLNAFRSLISVRVSSGGVVPSTSILYCDAHMTVALCMVECTVLSWRYTVCNYNYCGPRRCGLLNSMCLPRTREACERGFARKALGCRPLRMSKNRVSITPPPKAKITYFV